MHSKGGVNICFRAKNTRDLLDSQYSNWWMWLCNKQPQLDVASVSSLKSQLLLIYEQRWLWNSGCTAIPWDCLGNRRQQEPSAEQRSQCLRGRVLEFTGSCSLATIENCPWTSGSCRFLKAVYCSRSSSTISGPVYQMESLPTVWLLVHLSFGCGLKPNLAWENCRAS